MTNKEILENVYNTGKSQFLNTDGITFDLDAKGMADYLSKLGYKVIKHWDAHYAGLVELDNGLLVSSNGFVCIQ